MNRITKGNGRRGGFSRAELLGSVGTASALGALAWPVAAQGGWADLIFGRSVNGRRAATCRSNLKQIGLAVTMYTQDYNEKFPRATQVGDTYGWGEALYPYMKTREFLQCPADKHAAPAPASSTPAQLRAALRSRGYTDYWYSSRLSGKSLAAVDSLAQTLSFGDGDGGSALSTARYNIGALPKSWVATEGSPARRHIDITKGQGRAGEGANYAFVDGHVKWLTPGSIAASHPGATGQPTFALRP